jgi:hypothetical protein
MGSILPEMASYVLSNCSKQKFYYFTFYDNIIESRAPPQAAGDVGYKKVKFTGQYPAPWGGY